ncbi:Stf0 family sulfotransferase [Marinobacter sp. SS13-12]|uniref:Stf0 family sulfotransferase n=1 Tax=Marinobacter sp. SS13-12 TaxID=3050451 RepID=UPI00255632AA|nr:Stf0 family sulfotransferase [Marinobacter sp. SS13-12]MDK8464270.1 Stf0 family sulfotransferase [Marinobacter sp. SS13-12]
MHLYKDQFSDSHDFPRQEGPDKMLVIASTPRCGSHMLGHTLHQTGAFGFPLEYANPANLREWKRRIATESTEGVIRELTKRRTSPNGVFGIKLHYTHIRVLGGFDRVQALFPEAYYVLLSRKGILKQAVSLAIARQTGVWIAGQQPKNNNPPQYRFEQIERCLREVILDNSSWRYTLAANGCNYIEMDFDSVRKNLGASVQTIADFMGVQIDDNQVQEEHATSRQGSSLNDQWVAQFVRDFEHSSSELVSSEPGLKRRVLRKFRKMLSAG